MPSKPDLFFQRFIEPFLDGRWDEISDFYEEPFILVTPLGTESFSDRNEFIAFCADVRARFLGRGLAAITKQILDIRSFAPGLTMVDVNWFYLDQNGSTIADVITTYVLRERADTTRVAVHLSHTEYFNRTALPD